MPRPAHCAHCYSTGREVSLWDQIISFGRGTVCCWVNGKVDSLTN